MAYNPSAILPFSGEEHTHGLQTGSGACLGGRGAGSGGRRRRQAGHAGPVSANLEYIYTRRNVDKPGTGVLYVAPITGPLQQRAARTAGLHEVDNPVVLRVEGDNEAGLGHKVTQGWAMAGLTMQGLNMSVIGGKFVGYASFDSVQDANRAAAILGDLGAHPPVLPK